MKNSNNFVPSTSPASYILLMISFCIFFYIIGYSNGSRISDEKIKIAAAEQFASALRLALDENVISINTNELRKLEAELTK